VDGTIHGSLAHALWQRERNHHTLVRHGAFRLAETLGEETANGAMLSTLCVESKTFLLGNFHEKAPLKKGKGATGDSCSPLVGISQQWL
jgi:hypothetical protein